jgi:hypothetical protein
MVAFGPPQLSHLETKRHTVRFVLVWVLILHTLHAPIPCPDLDGECRGMPIESLSESHAWHFLLLGVQSPKDIDRGPFAPARDASEKRTIFSPYGDEALQPRDCLDAESEPICIQLLEPVASDVKPGSPARRSSRFEDDDRRRSHGIAHCALLCRWLI